MESESMEGRSVWNTNEEEEENETPPTPMNPAGGVMTVIMTVVIETVVAAGTTKGKFLRNSDVQTMNVWIL